ncbi:ABC transporter permease [Brenneria tiliae]|uniref:ABC transporter permease n=1 Tax=Brenneria tiliae TaxID=2914984 RepID=A0ABT0MY87_9GAMM|nr:ABC transporter permease [Brenneria tiliae]MCL2894184.1 ABC transporter permease [Brenneria tiliae]MCL2898829.1 ABC transporter permease [Brenneria tiliae]MCL2903234.1 ABC transporter permease [Brenneria tiliae]
MLLAYFARRLLLVLPIALGISLLVFLLINLQPGDPYALMIDPSAPPAVKEALLRKVGYYDPLYLKYLKWLARIVQGDFGFSLHYRAQVGEVIAGRLGNTLLLAGAALTISLLVAVPVGILAALHRNSPLDTLAVSLSFVFFSIPSFFFGLVLIKIFAVDLRWLPVSGKVTLGHSLQGIDYALDVLRHLALPALVLGLMNSAVFIKYLRSSMLGIIDQDFIRTLYAKGLSRRRIIWRHALKNAAKPMITILSLEIPVLFSGALMTETVFSWPGIGRLNYEAVLNRDYNLLMGIIMLLALLTLVANLLADMLYALVDPRVRYAS